MKKQADEVSFIPPHLIDSSGSLTPAALIPFCAYQTNMTLMGQTSQDLPFTACSHFKAIVLEGQLCYSLNLNLIAGDRTKAGVEYGLLMLLDPGTNGHIEDKDDKTAEQESKITSLNLKPINELDSSLKIYLNTLASFSGYRAGSFALSGLKKMTGTDSFIALPDESKGCQIETFEECQSQRYVQELQRQCGCLPWTLSSAVKEKVSRTLLKIINDSPNMLRVSASVPQLTMTV